MDRATSIRIISRETDTLNDSTMSIVDTDMSIGSIIYIGFIEAYSNVLLIVTSSEITLHSVNRPQLVFQAPDIIGASKKIRY